MGKTRRVRRVRRNITKRVRTRKMYGGFGYGASDPYGQYGDGQWQNGRWIPPTTTARSWGSFFRRRHTTTKSPHHNISPNQNQYEWPNGSMRSTPPP